MEEHRMAMTARSWLKKLTSFREFMVLMAVIFLALFIYSFNQRFFGAYNIQGVLRQIAIFGLLGIAETSVIITAGIDLSPGSMLAFNGVIVAMLMSQGLGYIPAIIIVLAICAIIGLYHGFLITRIGLTLSISTWPT